MPSRRLTARPLRCAALAAAFLTAAAAHSGSATATFTVQINLVGRGAPPDAPATSGREARAASANTSYCVSAALSEETNAHVRVVCATGEFVDIQPVENRLFAGTNGGAYRFALGAREDGRLPALSTVRGSSAGTVTRLDLFDVAQRQDALEMLVSF